MSKHTPGPWYVIEGNYTHAATINKSTKERICAVEFPDFKNGNNGHALEWQANAYLLASAPEMYEALKKLLMHYHRGDLHSIDYKRIEFILSKIEGGEK